MIDWFIYLSLSNPKRIENYHRTCFSIYYYSLRCPTEVTDEFGIDSGTAESNARHFHLINSNQAEDESAVYTPGMPNVFTTSGYLTLRMKIKITLRKNLVINIPEVTTITKGYVTEGYVWEDSLEKHCISENHLTGGRSRGWNMEAEYSAICIPYEVSNLGTYRFSGWWDKALQKGKEKEQVEDCNPRNDDSSPLPDGHVK